MWRKKTKPKPEAPALPDGYRIRTGLSGGSYGYSMAFLYNPAGRKIADEVIHTITSGEKAADRAFRNLIAIAQADAKWGTR